MRTPISVAVRLLPIDQLSSGVCRLMPSPYLSAMMRPFHVTTNAAVTSAADAKAASAACFTLGASSSAGCGSLDRTSPMGHGRVEASGRRLLSLTGVKFTEFLPTGSVTHPWSPRYMAVRVTPFGSVMCTALWTRSITGFPTCARSAYGLVKYPTFSAAKSGSRPVMNTAEHMILAKPDVRCSRGSPGGGTYGVLSSSDLARAMRASRLETVACGGGAPVFTAGVSAWYPRAAAQAVSASAVAIMRILICYLLLRGARPASPCTTKEAKRRFKLHANIILPLLTPS